jgi:hypothetical protein
MISADGGTLVRHALKGLRKALARLWPELKRLNSMGLPGVEDSSRAVRRAAFRAALSQKYRDRSPCC